MKQIIECIGKNVEKAIESGLKQLGKDHDDVDIKILDEGGIFRKARVELSYDDGQPEIKTKYDIGDEFADEKPKKKEEKSKAKQDKKEQKDFTEKNTESKVSKKENINVPADGNLIKIGEDFLKGLCSKLNITVSIDVVKTESGTVFKVSGERVSELIGYRGETLNAIQFILSTITKNAGFRDERVFLDVENYKVRREESLIALGQRLCQKALRIGKPVRLEPMSAYERRIIHTALQDESKVFTKSEGEEPRRYLVIIPKREK